MFLQYKHTWTIPNPREIFMDESSSDVHESACIVDSIAQKMPDAKSRVYHVTGRILKVIIFGCNPTIFKRFNPTANKSGRASFLASISNTDFRLIVVIGVLGPCSYGIETVVSQFQRIIIYSCLEHKIRAPIYFSGGLFKFSTSWLYLPDIKLLVMNYIDLFTS